LRQLWFGEISEYSTSLINLRQTCSSNVIRKIAGEPAHNPLYNGQPTNKCKYPEHYDVDLVDLKKCVDVDTGVDNCVFKLE
jgi:hypothetical protein